jgi:tripartite-type tricarboxylate transporter receptor subunit TctC
VTSVIRGDTHIYYLSVNLATELHQAGKVRAIAVATPKRTAAMPNLPTAAETGLPGYKFDAWFGVMAPVNTPRPILNKVSRDIARVLQTPDISERLTKQGVDIVLSSPDSFDAIIREDTNRNVSIIRGSNAWSSERAHLSQTSALQRL